MNDFSVSAEYIAKIYGTGWNLGFSSSAGISKCRGLMFFKI
jgi:hypothetical protein